MSCFTTPFINLRGIVKHDTLFFTALKDVTFRYTLQIYLPFKGWPFWTPLLYLIVGLPGVTVSVTPLIRYEFDKV